MSDFFQSMTYPFLACLLLAGIHVYLGIHVISRKVIFVDLALAQIAAFGSVYGILLGYGLHEDPWAIKGFSLGLTVIGAAVFALARMRHERVPQEAIIGITYAVALAATILASSHLPHGADEMRALLSGSILWVDGDTLIYTGVLYAGVGAFHYAFRNQFLSISLDPEKAEASGINARLWDFLFYVSFGFVVTSSVGIAGVLLVFSFLVIPAVVAVLFAESISRRLAIGWAVGTVVSFVGVVVSYVQDLPSGPTIVVVFAVFLVCAAVVYYLVHAPSLRHGLVRFVAGALVAAVLVAISLGLKKEDQHDPIAMLRSAVKNERLIALGLAEADVDVWQAVVPLIRELLRDPEPEVRAATVSLVEHHHHRASLPHVYELLDDEDDLVREDSIRCIKHIGGPDSVAPLLAAVRGEEDEYLKVETAETILELGDPRGIPALIEIMDEGETPQVRKDAHEHLLAHTRLELPFHADDAPDQNDEQVQKFDEWWSTYGRSLVWHPETKIFELAR